MRDVNSIFEMVQKYAGETMFIVLFLVCIISLLSNLKKKDVSYIIWVLLLSLFLIFNEISLKFLGIFTDDATFYRFLWAVPVLFVIAYGFVMMFSKLSGKVVKVSVVLLCLLMFGLCTDSYLTKESITYPGTTEKIPGDVKVICEIINKNKQSERPRCVFDLSILMMVRSEEPSIVWGVTRQQYLEIIEMGYDREDSRYPKIENLVKVVNDGIQVPKRKLRHTLNKRKIEFLVVKKEFQMTEYFKAMGIPAVGESDNYVVYQYIKK